MEPAVAEPPAEPTGERPAESTGGAAAAPGEPGSSVPAGQPAPAAESAAAPAGPPGAMSTPAPAAAPAASPAAVPAAPVLPDPRLADYRLLVRSSFILLGLIVVAVALVPVIPRILNGPDLAKDKPWRASSKYADCHPEQLVCGEGKTSIFFHTRLENQPWVEIDLGAPTSFRSVEVDNRRDGPGDVLDRAVPLILEVGNDQKTWTKLGEQDSTFRTWKAKFPATTARYVRLRSPRSTFLHLEAVRVHP